MKEAGQPVSEGSSTKRKNAGELLTSGTRTEDNATGAPLGLYLSLDGTRTVRSVVNSNAVEALYGSVEGLPARLGRVDILAFTETDEAVSVSGNDEGVHAGVFALGRHVLHALEDDGVTVEVAHLFGRERGHGGQVLLRVDFIRVRGARENERVG